MLVNDFYGRPLRNIVLNGMRVVELIYPAGLIVPKHYHENPYFTFVISGSLIEQFDGVQREVKQRQISFTPAEVLHSSQNQNKELHAICVELNGERGLEIAKQTKAFLEPKLIETGTAIQLADRLYSEIQITDAVTTLAVESVVLEILAETARIGNPRDLDKPKWLLATKEFIEANFSNGIKVTDVAKIAGVHPIHLTRMFQKHFECSIAEYMRDLRLEAAVRLIRDTDLPLSHIAAQTGFADQSHLTRTFQTAMGVTPAKFRRNRFAI